jgi:hypothetical protein
MTERKEAQKGLQSLRQALADDIRDASDEEILAQFTEDVGSPDENAARMRALFEKTVLLANKGRLHAARAGAATHKVSSADSPIPIVEARARLRQVLDAHAHDKSFTLAARKESELSDADVVDMLEVMRELGLLSE